MNENFNELKRLFDAQCRLGLSRSTLTRNYVVAVTIAKLLDGYTLSDVNTILDRASQFAIARTRVHTLED